MIFKKIPIMTNDVDTGAVLELYIQDTPHDGQLKVQKRPIVIICPGGGYRMISYREGEPIALHFLSRGYHACVLKYSLDPARFPTQLLELGQSVKLIRAHAAEWNIDADKIVIQGSSAGGHLAASYGVFWNQEFMVARLAATSEELKPKGIMLSYPVITSDLKYGHLGSFDVLLGDKVDQLRKTLSLETQITKTMPPCFVWHTMTDQTVPVENSLLLAMALRKAGVPAELHIFPEGEHGLSMANDIVECADGSGVQPECAQWVGLADRWLDKLCNFGTCSGDDFQKEITADNCI